MPEHSPEELCKIMFGLDYAKLVAANPSWKDTFQKIIERTKGAQKLSAEQSSDCVSDSSAKECLTPFEQRDIHNIRGIKAWGDILRSAFPWEKTLSVLDPILGCLKMNKHSIQIHRLEKDLVYLTAMSIDKGAQIFISFPVSPISLGILTVTYWAHLLREERDIYRTHHAEAAKDFAIWIRPKDRGKISHLRTTKAFNLIDNEYTKRNLNKRIACLPIHKFDESFKSKHLRVFMARSLSEAVDLLKSSKNCSLVVIDDPSGRTYPSPSAYGSQAFGLASLCRQKRIPMVGIVPPWTLQDIEYHETNTSQGILLWPIDFFALRSYPAELGISAKNREQLHPIEESYLLLERKRQSLNETQVTIKTFNFDTEDEEKIAELFQESSNLLLDLAKQPHCRGVWGTGWKIWRYLAAPVLPFYLLWAQFIEGALKQLNSAINQSKDSQAKILYNLLSSLALRLQKLKANPFIQIIKSAEPETIVAVENAEIANALEQFLMGNRSCLSTPKILPISEVRGLGGEKLIVIGQPKACHRDILQTTLFSKIDVLLWSVLAERAERWWSNLEVDAREWHGKTWRKLTAKEEVGCYSFSLHQPKVKIIEAGKLMLSKKINLAKIEENFNSLVRTNFEAELNGDIARNLESHYLVKFEIGLKIRVALGCEFLVLSGRQALVVAIRDIAAGTKVVLFDGMNRDELFAQKAGLLEDTKVNYLYRIHLDAWRAILKQQVKKLDLQTVRRELSIDTGLHISQETIEYNWMSGDDLLSLPREKEHFFWFIPPLARSGFEEFWQQANELRIKRRQLGQVISACAQEGWKDRKLDEIVFRYQQVFITVGELKDAMQILTVQSPPQLISQVPEYPINRLFRT